MAWDARARAKVDEMHAAKSLQLRLARAKEDIRRLDVVVHEAGAVKRAEEADKGPTDEQNHRPRYGG